MSRISRKPRQEIIDKQDYNLGRELAERWFTHYLETGTCNPGGSEHSIYCEIVASVIRDNKPITPKQIGLVKKLKKDRSDPFNGGVCDLLLEKINEYSQSQSAFSIS